jgi:hypothetical protein
VWEKKKLVVGDKIMKGSMAGVTVGKGKGGSLGISH